MQRTVCSLTRGSPVLKQKTSWRTLKLLIIVLGLFILTLVGRMHPSSGLSRARGRRSCKPCWRNTGNVLILPPSQALSEASVAGELEYTVPPSSTLVICTNINTSESQLRSQQTWLKVSLWPSLQPGRSPGLDRTKFMHRWPWRE